MSYDLNCVQLIGRLTKEPELKYTPNGKAVCSFSIAVGNGKKPDGTDATSFLNIVAWGKTAEAIVNYSGKGKQIAIEGKLEQRSWKAQDGTNRSTIEVIANRIQLLTPKDGTKNAGEPTFGGKEFDAKNDEKYYDNADWPKDGEYNNENFGYEPNSEPLPF